MGDDQTDSASLGAQTDRRKEEQLETSLLAVQPDDMAGKHRAGEQNPLDLAQFLEEEDKVVSKCECLALKPPSACEGMEGPGEPHSATQQTTAADGVSYAGCTRSPDQGGHFFCQAEVGMDLETTKNPRSPFREIGDVSVTTRDDSEEHI